MLKNPRKKLSAWRDGCSFSISLGASKWRSKWWNLNYMTHTSKEWLMNVNTCKVLFFKNHDFPHMWKHSCWWAETFVQLNLEADFHALQPHRSLIKNCIISCLYLELTGWVIQRYEITLSSHHSEASAPQATEKQQQTAAPKWSYSELYASMYRVKYWDFFY